jgi:alpha-tubulin suppressor-like RCC1 family protein
MGYNYYGELGDGTTASTNAPEQIVSTGVTAIAAGYHHSLFLKSDGSLWAVGLNSSGQLGDGTLIDHHTPERILSSGVTAIAAGYYFSLFLKSDGSLWAMGYNTDGELGDGTQTRHPAPEQIVPFVPTIVSISLSRTNLVVKGSNGLSGGKYYTLMNTNVAQPLSQWTPVTTNVLSASGNFTITVTNAVNRNLPQRFYILQLQ